MHKWSKEEIAAYRKEHSPLVYFNPDDSNIFVPKSLGLGFTINFGNPFAIIIIILLVTFIVLKKIGIF